MTARKKLIEVALPLDAINAEISSPGAQFAAGRPVVPEGAGRDVRA